MSTAPALRPLPPEHHGRGRRVLVWAGIVIAALGVLIAGVGYWMVHSERGAKFAFERLEHALPGTLKVDTLIGSIWGPLEVRDVSYKSERLQITMDRLRIAWSLRALLGKRLDVHDLVADNVRVEVAAAGDTIADKDTLKALPDLRLPLDIMIHRGLFQRVRIVSTAADSGARPDTSIALDRVTMRDMAFRDTLTIGSLAAVSPLGEVEVHGGGRTRKGYRADFTLSWKLHPPRLGPLSGHGTAIGSLDTLRVLQTIEGPLAADLDALVLAPARDLRIDGHMRVHDFDARALDSRLPAGHVAGRFDLRGRPLDCVSAGHLDATTAQYGRAAVDWVIEIKQDVLRVTSLAVTPHGRPGRLTARGSLEPGGARHVDLNAEWDDFAWPLTPRPSFVTPRGTLRIGGTLARWRLRGDAMVGVPALHDTARMTLDGVGDTTGINVAMATLGALGGTLSGHGRFDWASHPSWNLALAGRDLNPGEARPGLAGRVAFTGSSRGRLLDSGPYGTVAVPQVTGTVRQQPLAGHAEIGLAGRTTEVRALDLSLGPNRVTASGALGPQDALQWTLHAPDLAALLPRGAGTLEAQGTVRGPGAAPHVTATATGDSIHWDRYGLERLSLNLDLGGGPDGTLKLDADAANVWVAPRRFRHVGLHGDGTRARHALTLTTSSRDDSLVVALAGGLEGLRTWRGDLRRLDLTTPSFGSWSLTQPARVGAGAGQAELRGFCWHSGGARVCADATWTRNGAWTMRSTLEQVPLKLLSTLVPPDLDLDAPVNGTLDFHGQGESVRGDARITLGPGELRYTADGKHNATEHLDPSTLTVHADGAGLTARATLALVPAGRTDATVTLPGFRPARLADGSQALEGQLAVRLAELRVAQAFLPDLTRTDGRLDVDVRLLGTTAHPRWTGDARLAGAVADVPRFGLALRDGALTARAGPSGRLRFDGGVQSGDGRLTVQGTAALGASGLAALDATIAGRELTASKTRELTVIVSPDLHLTVHGDSLMLAGQVRVPRADVREPRETKPPVAPSQDVVFVGRVDDQKTREPLKLHSEVRVVLGSDIRVRARGLDGKPTGSVLTIRTPGQPVLATGQLQLAEGGTYKAYGQNLSIETGRLIFGGGPIDNPGLDVRASRKARDGVTAGFEVHGTLEAPQLTVFSDPPMAERDALAYALLGHGLDQSNQSENGILDQAANSLGLRGGNYVAGTLARQLGLDEASIESESGTFQNSALRLGAYLSPRVYVNYGVGILDQLSRLRIQYFLSGKWTLQAETGTENSAQVLYTFERGHKRERPPLPPSARRDSLATMRSQAPRH